MAWYSTGTVSVTNGNATVTGSGTAWVANSQASEGIWLPDGRLYEIVSINSDTSLTISPNYLGTTQSGQDYRIVPVKGYPLLAAQQMAALISTVQGYVDGALSGRFGNGTVGAPGISFASNTAMGLYRVAANQLGIATNGVRRVLLSNTAMQVDVPVIGSAVADSKWDRTSGRLTTAGAGGVVQGGSINANAIIGSSGSLNDLPAGTNCGFSVSHSEKPQSVYGSGNTAGYVYTTEWNTGSRMQIATLTYPSSDHGVQLMRLEESPGGPWGDWRVLGAPEYGSNANGEYTKFADGTMICTGEVDLAYGGSAYCSSAWTFPAAFSEAPSTTASATNTAGYTPNETELLSTRAPSATTSSGVFRIARVTGATDFQPGDTVTVNATAIGRWF